MRDPGIHPELHEVERRVRLRAIDTPMSSDRALRLRNQLLRRHNELYGDGIKPARARRLPRLAVVRRIAILAPPALAAAIAASVFLYAFGPSGGQSTPAAEAARITRAFARSVPTVTAWQVTLTRQQSRTGSEVSQVLCQVPLKPRQHLYVRDGRTYFFSDGTWYRVTSRPLSTSCPSNWQWAFADLPRHLSQYNFSILKNSRIDGRPATTVRYTLDAGGGRSVVVTAWVNVATGLTERLERDNVVGGQLRERDVADYEYSRSG